MAVSDAVSIREHLREGQVVPAHPLALDAARRLDERRQHGVTRGLRVEAREIGVQAQEAAGLGPQRRPRGRRVGARELDSHRGAPDRSR